MNDRQKTVAAVSIIIGVLLLVGVIVGAFLSRKTIVSPIPEEAAIKVIFVTQAPTLEASPSGVVTLTVSEKLTPTKKPTAKITPSPKLTPSASVTPLSETTPTPKASVTP